MKGAALAIFGIIAILALLLLAFGYAAVALMFVVVSLCIIGGIVLICAAADGILDDLDAK